MRKSSVTTRQGRLWLALPIGLVMLAIAGCPMKFVSDYDNITDKAVFDLQKKTDAFLLKMQDSVGTSAASYSNNVGFYDGAKADLNAILFRAEAIPQNSLTVDQLVHLDSSFAHMRAEHQRHGDAGLSATDVRLIQESLDPGFKSIIIFETAKKRGR